MKEYIERENAEKVFSNARKHMKPENYTGQEFFIRDNILLNAEQIVHAIPAADVVDGESYRELLKAARKMHCWIFLNTADELDAYDECGLTDEMNALLGYGGQFTANMDGGVNDV